MIKLLKSKKALSPVVAAIILIAVTVAVSIAVAAWMGSLTIGFMETTEMTITDVTFNPSLNNMTVAVTNSGTSDATISMVKVNGNTILSTAITGSLSFDSGTNHPIDIPYTPINAGTKYAITFFANDGTLIGSYTDTA